MKRYEKVITIILAVLIIIFGAAITQTQPDNCWDKYTTEQQAIQHCEINKGE
jgi:hypothetical protein